jgi:hypothetical protein
MRFLARDENGETFGPDADFAAQALPLGVEHVLQAVCGLDPSDELDGPAYRAVLNADVALRARLEQGSSVLPPP